ncbi:MAG: SPOR domain-containing protein [Prevotella sp.]|nr:SPOR domain-containing protein [Prevotella sp.]
MKKYFVFCAGLCVALAFTSCKSSESAYKKAYEKAKQYDTAQQQQQVQQPVEQAPVVVAPVEARPATEARVVDNADNVSVRREQVSLVNGGGLKAYSVVVGSFSVLANAEGLQQHLKEAGYAAQIVKNVDRNMYRVVASTFDSKISAAQSRDQFRAQEAYKDAWLLYNGQ